MKFTSGYHPNLRFVLTVCNADPVLDSEKQWEIGTADQLCRFLKKPTPENNVLQQWIVAQLSV